MKKVDFGDDATALIPALRELEEAEGLTDSPVLISIHTSSQAAYAYPKAVVDVQTCHGESFPWQEG